jgi:hypothetical protein
MEIFLLEVVGTILGGKMLKLSGISWSGVPQTFLEMVLLYGLQYIIDSPEGLCKFLWEEALMLIVCSVDLLTKIEIIYFFPTLFH